VYLHAVAKTPETDSTDGEAERRKEFIDEVFEEIQFDRHGIRAALPRTEYGSLVALTEVSRGDGRGDWI
jgi:hypothetical protein